jgi:hypothetical protein
MFKRGVRKRKSLNNNAWEIGIHPDFIDKVN